MLLMGVVVWGCASLKKQYPEKRNYLVEATREKQGRASASDLVLEVLKIECPSEYQGRELVYRMGDFSYESDFYNNYFIAPDLMLTDQCRKWMEETGLFSNVVGRTSILRPALILQGALVSLYGDYRSGDQPEAVIEIQFLLLDNRLNPPGVLFQKNYGRQIPLKSRGAEELVRGMSEGLSNILSSLEEDLSSAGF